MAREEKRIAGKMLSHLMKSDDLSLVDESIHKITTPYNINIENNVYVQDNSHCIFEDILNYSVGFSFPHYVDQSVYGLPAVDVQSYEEYNYAATQKRQEDESEKSLWSKFRNFLNDYIEVSTAKELLEDLKEAVSDSTGIRDSSELENVSLIMLNIYNRQKSTTGRKDELMRLFKMKNFGKSMKISAAINSIIKETQTTDFDIRWVEVFKYRVEKMEEKYSSKEAINDTNNGVINNNLAFTTLLPSHLGLRRDKRKQRKQFLNTCCFIEKLSNKTLPVEIEITPQIDNPMIAEVSINLKNSKTESLLCRSMQNYFPEKISRDDATVLSIARLHTLLQDSKNNHKKNNKSKSHKTVSCIEQFHISSEDSEDENNQLKYRKIGKNWIAKQLNKFLSRDILESLNYKLIIQYILDLIKFEKNDVMVEERLVDAFRIENISLITELMSARRSIKFENDQNNTSKNKKFTMQPLDAEIKKMKWLFDQKKLAEQEKQKSAAVTKTTKENYKIVQKKDESCNIFDSNLEMRMSAGFVSGAKIMLPEQHVRKDTKKYEEILIPSVNNTKPLIDQELIEISSLDNIGQTVFSGIKSLNRIQSIVFKAAYLTNQNLLICAPTGAGKTNVALLTVVHEIKQNIESGVLKRDKFKIVYIAPMKALAAEMATNFANKLKPLNIVVRELTGDMQLTKQEISKTQMLITTPEKWDLVTRKGENDSSLSSLVKLLIIDEVHLLHSDRGPVIEAIVARTLRQVETYQKMIRIVGLSATLPNYKDVASFLGVNLQTGLFYFDSRFRPVPLSQCFIGVKAQKHAQQITDMNEICYEKIIQHMKNNMQVMVFVHARNMTAKTAIVLRDMAAQKKQLGLFEPDVNHAGFFLKLFNKTKSNQLQELMPTGFAIHHAGLLRHDRNIVEECFAKGYIKVLVCTSTLAWGVNLPAHAVIIKGTEIYDAKHGKFIDLGILDVLQIFGRAGRPQFNETGHGIIITTHNKLHQYLGLMMNQFPIESHFVSYLADNLNAEITLGTITSIEEAIEWLSYTYLFVRMRINPQVYGISYDDVEDDNLLIEHREALIRETAKNLDKSRMIRYNEELGRLSSTDLGRTASLFYVSHGTIDIFSTLLKDVMNEPETINMLSQAHEFEQLKVRDDEMDELDRLQRESCEYTPAGGSENLHGKVNILLQTYLSRGYIKSFSLISDLFYISQNASRIMRALFNIVLRQNNAILTEKFLKISQMFELQQWFFETPLRQFKCLSSGILDKIDQREISIDRFKDMDSNEIGNILRDKRVGQLVKKCVDEFPVLIVDATVQPITRTVLRVRLNIKADFTWNDVVHGKTTEPFWVWVQDPETNFLYHSEYFNLGKKKVVNGEAIELVFTIPMHEPLPSQYVIRVPSDRWLGSENHVAVSMNGILLPEIHPMHTELLPLQPLPITALQCNEYERLYKFTHFNPIQTQIFHTLYHTDHNVLLGAPTGSGKTIVAEVAFFRVFKSNPDAKVVYIAPLKALVKERMKDWKVRLQKSLNKEVIELTGDVTPDVHAIQSASVIVTTPEKWDSISRSWQTRNYVKKVVLLVIDEIHLLGEDRGPVLEVIVSRTNFISARTGNLIRVIGLSTAVANAEDLANWLRIKDVGLYNFRPSVRPVPLEVHISAFPGKHYCPRMASMNKPAFHAIKQYSPTQPVLIFVSSRRQTRLTAMDLLAHLASEQNPKQWVKLKEAKMQKILATIKDEYLKIVLSFGIGMHHAGLHESDRKQVEDLFEHQHIQVLVATATLAWGVNFPAHLVIIKGTEYFDCKSHGYKDQPITDVLQMMGRAGRPQFDKEGVAVVMVHDIKKNFYKRFLYEPFPVESHLLDVLPDHLNAEIVAGTIRTAQNAIEYMTWTYFFRRLLKNPVFYAHDKKVTPDTVNEFLTELITNSCKILESASMLTFDQDGRTLYPTSMARIASYYYISYQTMIHFTQTLHATMSVEEMIDVLSKAHEYHEVPVRHNEEIMNAELAKVCKFKIDERSLDSPFTKTNLLIQAHCSRLSLPCTDYFTDLKMVLDNAIRIMQAIIDVCGENGWLLSTLIAQLLLQMIIQARWHTDDPLTTLPHIEDEHVHLFQRNNEQLSLPRLMHTSQKNYGNFLEMLQSDFQESIVNKIYEVICHMPLITIDISIKKSFNDMETEMPQDEFDELNSAILIDPKIPIMVDANSDYVIQVKVTHVNRKDLKVHAPKFSKPKDESWFLTFGDADNNELYALKRVSFGKRKEVFQNFIFHSPNIHGSRIITIYLFSDSYIGLDQQFNITIEV